MNGDVALVTSRMDSEPVDPGFAWIVPDYSFLARSEMAAVATMT